MKITPEMVREAEAHFPFALAEGPTKGPRWQWFADFYNHALENPGAPCPCCNVTPDGDIMDHLPDPPEPGASTEPWPRFILDEALVVLRNVDTQFRATGQPSARVERLINLLAGMEGRTAPQPPSAPVGVERILAEMREEGQADIVDGGVVLEWEDDLRNALAQQPAAEVYVDFPQVGTAGPLAVVDGKVTLPDATMNDLIRHARTGYVEQPAAVDGAMVKAAQEQISEGIGAYLRKFTDSEAAKHAREHLHQMPASEWSGMTRMLAEEAVGAALAAQQGGGTDE